MCCPGASWEFQYVLHIEKKQQILYIIPPMYLHGSHKLRTTPSSTGNRLITMKASGVFLLALASVLAVSITHVQAAIIEIPDELLNEGVFIKEDGIREKRQVVASGGGSEYGGSVRLDGRRNVFDNGRTRVDGKGSYQFDYARGMKPHHSGGLGADVSHNVWKGRGGQTLDVTAGYQRNFNTPNRHNANVGVIYRWK